MKESMWGYWFIVLGLSIMSIMILVQNYTTTNEQDYYLIKSVLESSMYESVDYAYFRDTSRIRMNSEKFVENFLRRFSESVNINKTYEIIGKYMEYVKKEIKENKNLFGEIKEKEIQEFLEKIENHIVRHIYKYVFPQKKSMQDSEFLKKTRNLDWILPEHLEIKKC